jgi:UDP-N-acetylglucosamine 2-epimerase (non-hydrolysing)
MAPVIASLRASGWARCVVVVTAQHRDLLDQILGRLQVPVDHDLDLMIEGQSPAELVARMLPALDHVLASAPTDVVLAQGDTTTVFVAALAAFYRQIPFGHVEAGLRTGDIAQPFPEEGYRQMVARITRWHFSPTQGASDHLVQEGVPRERIHVTGNTGIDTLLQTVNKLGPVAALHGRVILLTAHRRESFGAPLRQIFLAVRAIVERYSDVCVVYPMHPNPNVQSAARELLGGHERIKLCASLDYFEFVELMRNVHLILTDSGGIQEEAPALAKPVLILRNQTERPEAVEIGVARLVGTQQAGIFAAACELLDDTRAYSAMAQGASPYGDGHAAERIVELLRSELSPRDISGVT